MSKIDRRNSGGFTLLELMVSMAVFLILSGAMLGGLGKLQSTYRTAEVRTTMQQRLRSTMELMAQEIGQAGLQASTIDNSNVVSTSGAAAAYTLTGSISTGLQTVTISSVAGIYVGQWLQVDGGANQDPIQVTAVNASTSQITATFGKAHASASIPAYPLGVFPHGIVSDQSNASRLIIFGDINGIGSGSTGLLAVEYSCPTTGTGSLMRTEWTLPNTTATQYALIDNVPATGCYFCWPGSTDSRCPTGAATPNTVGLSVPSGTTCPAGSPSGYCSYTMITQVGFTITAQENVTISGSTQTISITKSYSNIQPRNIVAANAIYNQACSQAGGGSACSTPANYAPYIYGELQPDPPSLSTITWY